MKKIILCAIASAFMANPAVQAQSTTLGYDYPQGLTPTGLDTYSFSTYYFNGPRTYNLRGAYLSKGGEIAAMKVNPSGSSFAVIESNSGKVKIFDLWKSNKLLQQVTCSSTPVQMAFSNDARSLAIGQESKSVDICSTDNYTVQRTLTAGVVAKCMAYSKDDALLAVADDRNVEVWAPNAGTLRKRISAGARINDIAFADDDTKLLVATNAGKVEVYDAQTLNSLTAIDNVGDAKTCTPTPDGKYVAVVTNPRQVVIVNLLDPSDRKTVDNEVGGTTDARFVQDSKENIYLVHNTSNSVVYSRITSLSPYLRKMLSMELNQRMDAWKQKKAGESDADYQARVNEKTISEQIKLQERELATKYVKNVDLPKLTASNAKYDPSSELLILQTTGTASKLKVKMTSEEAAALPDMGKLQMRNPKYRINEKDQAELVAVTLVDPTTGKEYQADAEDMGSTSSTGSLAQNDNNLVSLEVIRNAQKETNAIETIKEEETAKAQKQQLISNHTKINVAMKPIVGRNAKGDKTVNYKASFDYAVEPAYSASEDFALGSYNVNESGAAKAVLNMIKKSFDTNLAKYAAAGKQVQIKIKGSADAVPINNPIAYDGRYGTFNREPVTKGGRLTNVTLNSEEGIATNEQLAFARAASMKDYLMKNVPALKKMQDKTDYEIEVSNSKGGEYRRVSVEFTFVDAQP
ncbi:MAG: WD40 repeat domain-containing protein [Bacteroidaceae bacterium]|nr:WD40 repeat domain-containing protein [Bacteroidaceae bacterium]